MLAGIESSTKRGELADGGFLKWRRRPAAHLGGYRLVVKNKSGDM